MSATPAMRQYLDAKQQHRDAILMFRMGDFYEMFYEDALVASRALELTLTSRSKGGNGGIPMCGVPFHAVDTYIGRLVKKGFRVAICDQVEDPRKAKGIVKREVVRVVSPGTLTDANYLDAREPAFLMAIAPISSRSQANPQTAAVGVALLDLTAPMEPRLSPTRFWCSSHARSSYPPATPLESRSPPCSPNGR
jgi:DNA mismatch repair ATPase MutS